MGSITSLGVGSGLDLESIVSSLVSLKKSTKVTPINNKEALKELEVTGLSSLKSSMTSLADHLKKISDGSAINKRTVETTLSEENPEFGYELKKDVSNCSHDIAVKQLAYGTKIKGSASSENFFSEQDADGNTVYRSRNAGQISFTVGSGDDAESFSIDIGENDSLSTIMKKINEADGNDSVSMNYVVGSDGSINRLSGDTNRLGISGDGSDNEIQGAQNAKMLVDGIEVSSATNKFKDQVSGLELTAKKVSKTDDEGNYITNSITVSEDQSEMKNVANTFVSKFNSLISKFNSLMSTCDKLYSKNTYTNGKCNYDGGDLAGDPICQSVKNSLKNVINNYVSSDGKTLYQMGISINKSGTLEVDSSKLESTLSSNYDGFINVMKDLSDKLNSAVDVYTKSKRSEAANNEWKDLKSKLSSMDEYMKNYEDRLRKKYTSLDTILANMNTNMSYISSILTSSQQ